MEVYGVYVLDSHFQIDESRLIKLTGLPFRRMDLQDDGSWKAISWPLPRGETRDMSHDCKIHHSVIKRMEHDASYRPGNLIVGGGGRGFIKAPKEYGTGVWEVILEPGDAIGEVKRKVQTEANGNGKTHGKSTNGKSTNRKSTNGESK